MSDVIFRIVRISENVVEFECEECDTKQNGQINLNDHMSWTHEDYYDFYGFKFAKRKVTRLRSLLHENHKYVIGMIGIAVFFAME